IRSQGSGVRGQTVFPDAWPLTYLLSGLLGFLRVNQAVVVRVEFLENAARSEEFLPGQVAVLVPVHPLEPQRADRRPRRTNDRRDRGPPHPACAEQLEAAADDLEVQSAGRIGRPEDRLPRLAQVAQGVGREAELTEAQTAVVVPVERLKEPVAQV